MENGSVTSVHYGTLSLNHEYYLHTDCYEVTEHSEGLTIYVEYILSDTSEEPGIKGSQKITITRTEDFDS